MIHDATYQSLVKRIGIDAYIDPCAITISRIQQYIRHGKIRRIYDIRGGQVEVIEIEVLSGSPIVGQILAALNLPSGMRFATIYRQNQVLIPNSQTKFQEGDLVLIFGQSNATHIVNSLFQAGFEYF